MTDSSTRYVIHVIEYLWEAGRAFHPESGPELEKWVQHRLRKILQGKAGHMAGGMRSIATRRNLTPEKRQPVEKCATYLLNKSPYLRYDRYLDEGLPVAIGVIEGACRHLVKDRMEITGAKWTLLGAEAVLRLRALHSSKDFDVYWVFHEKCEYKRNHQAHYADGIVPANKNSTSADKKTNTSSRQVNSTEIWERIGQDNQNDDDIEKIQKSHTLMKMRTRSKCF